MAGAKNARDRFAVHRHIELHLARVQRAVAQLFAEFAARLFVQCRGAACVLIGGLIALVVVSRCCRSAIGAGPGTGRGQQQVQQPVLGRFSRLALHIGMRAGFGHVDCLLDQVADHALDVAPVIADFRIARRFDFDERRAGERREPPRDLRLADAGRADHQNIFRRHFALQIGIKLLAPPAVSQRNRDGALGRVLADDVAVQLGDNLARSQIRRIGA